MPFVDVQVKYTERDTATAYPGTSEAVTGLVTECEDSTNWNTSTFAAGVGPIALSMGTISCGRFFVLNVVGDIVNGREPLEVRLNGSVGDAWTGTLLVLEADSVTGITSVFVTNPGINSIKVNWVIAGDAVS
ncbi:MAG: hypothetical protein KAH32_07460 [Chlamydiia bacterium]|nr:hypothetical protein [Chlamydiia bacterium]